MAYTATPNQRKQDEKVLDELHEIFKDARHWVKGKSAADEYGKSASIRSDNVCSVCLSGGVERLSRDNNQHLRLSELIRDHLPGKYKAVRTIPTFNDAQKTVIDDVRAVVAAARAHVRHLNGH